MNEVPVLNEKTNISLVHKRICIVSPEEDFRLKLALLLSGTCLVEMCGDWDSLLHVAGMHETGIAVIDSTLLKYCTSARRRILTNLARDRRLYVVGVYPYQLDTELVERKRL